MVLKWLTANRSKILVNPIDGEVAATPLNVLYVDLLKRPSMNSVTEDA